MKGTDRIILVALPLLALLVGFWMLVIGPKRGDAGELGTEAETLRAAITSTEAEIATAEQAKKAFPDDYANLISLGTAVPEDNDQATLLRELSTVARRESVSLRTFTLVPGTGEPAPAPAPAPAAVEPSATEPPGEEPVAAPAAPTEAAAAALPLGATVGPAGLPITPYKLTYHGEFFEMADLFAALDSRVKVDETGAGPTVEGRLITIDGFAMTADPVRGFPSVQTDLDVTTYLVPAEQGIAVGADPGGPALTGSGDVPAAVPDPASPVDTAAVTP